jgi:uncharacterized membrane protein
MAARVFFDVTLEPNRPLRPAGMVIVIGTIAAISFVAGIVFMLRGAWPVTPFFGADVALLAWAFRASVRASQRREHLILTQDALVIERFAPDGSLTREEINPYWLRIEHDDPEGLGCPVALVSRGRRWIVGNFLGAEDRTRLADALRIAVREARTALPE